jgi:hypothetical protein
MDKNVTLKLIAIWSDAEKGMEKSMRVKMRLQLGGRISGGKRRVNQERTVVLRYA